MPPAKILDVVPDFPAVANSYVCVFAQMHTYARINESILLIHRDREPYLGFWNLCGGKIKDCDFKGTGLVGERSNPEYRAFLNTRIVAAAKVAALRELKEEVGYDGSFPQYMGHMYSTPFDHPGSYLVHFVRAIVNPSTQHEDYEYKDHTLWVPTRQLTNPANAMVIVPNLRYILPLLVIGMQGWCFAEHYSPGSHGQDNTGMLQGADRYVMEIPEFSNGPIYNNDRVHYRPGERFFPQVDQEMKDLVAAARIPLCDGPGSGEALITTELDTSQPVKMICIYCNKEACECNLPDH